MKIYLRKSVISSVKPETLQEMLQITQLGMKYYQDLFGMGYQFSKYD